MSRIRGKDTKPEMLVRKFLFINGFRYRLHDLKLPGKPDLVLAKHKTVVFINGCFWHGHKECRYFSIPKTRSEWWEAKINKNIINDENVRVKLKKLGRNIITIWGCELKKRNIDVAFENLVRLINENSR